MANMTYWDREAQCQSSFEKMGPVFHCCTPENHPLLFRSQEDYKTAISILGICTGLFSSLCFLTFEIMSNHIHLVIAGDETMILEMFECFRKYLARYFNGIDSPVSLKDFNLRLFRVQSLENLRNVIAYNNRNGAKVDPNTTPMSYPWGANMYFFSPEARQRYLEQRQLSTVVWRRSICHSRRAEDARKIYLIDGYASPLSFCNINLAESTYRDARHYFNKISSHVENYDEIAKMIGEQVSYTDDDLYYVVLHLCRHDYDVSSPNLLTKEQKIGLAKKMRFDYNANNKQIARMLKMPLDILNTLF